MGGMNVPSDPEVWGTQEAAEWLSTVHNGAAICGGVYTAVYNSDKSSGTPGVLFRN